MYNKTPKRKQDVASGIIGIAAGIGSLFITLIVFLIATGGMEARESTTANSLGFVAYIIVAVQIGINVLFFVAGWSSLSHRGIVPAFIGTVACLIFAVVGAITFSGLYGGVVHFICGVCFFAILLLQWKPSAK